MTEFIFLSDFIAHMNEIGTKIPCREMTMKEILYILNTSENKRRILKYKRKYTRFIIFPSYIDTCRVVNLATMSLKRRRAQRFLCVTDLLVEEFHGGFKQF